MESTKIFIGKNRPVGWNRFAPFIDKTEQISGIVTVTKVMEYTPKQSTLDKIKPGSDLEKTIQYERFLTLSFDTGQGAKKRTTFLSAYLNALKEAGLPETDANGNLVHKYFAVCQDGMLEFVKPEDVPVSQSTPAPTQQDTAALLAAALAAIQK